MNELKTFNIGPDDGSWRTPAFRQNVVAKIDESIQRSGTPTSRNSIEMENHVFQKAKTKEEYLSMVARLILHVRDINSKKGGMVGGPGTPQGMAGGPGNSQGNSGPVGQGQGAGGPTGGQGVGNPSGQGMNPDPINALQNLTGQGPRNNQMLNNMGPQGQMQVSQPNMGPGGQVGMGPQQSSPLAASSLLQTLNQRPQLNMQQLQNKMGPGMGMMQNQGQMVNQMGGGQMNNPNQMGPGGMNPQMGGNNPMGGQMVQNQMNPNMPGQMVGPNQMGGQMGNMNSSQMSMMQLHMQQQQRNKDGPGVFMGGGGPGMGQGGPGMGPGGPGMGPGGPGMGPGGPGMGPGGSGMGPGGQGMVQGGPGMGPGGPGMGQGGQGMGQNCPGMGQGGGGPRAGAPSHFLRQSPSPSAQPSPAPMGGPSPASMGMMSGPMASPMSVGSGGLGVGGGAGAGGVASPALAPSPSPHHPSPHHPSQQHSQQHMQQHQRSIGMAPSPSSSLNTPLGGGAAPSPGGGGEEHAYREKVRQLSKYIEPLRRMIARMVSDGENVEKLTKMKNFLDILSHPSKRMPLETLLKCEVVLEKLDFKRGEGMSVGSQSNPLHLQGLKEHQIFNPLLEVVNNSLQSPVANHTLKRTFGPCVEALCGPEIRHMPSPFKKTKVEEPNPDIPDILQGEIARLDSRFKVSLEGLQVGTGGNGAIRLIAQLEDARLPCVPPVCVRVPREYPSRPPACLPPAAPYSATPFLRRVHAALAVRLAALPRRHSLSQLLDTWEMSVRQACNPNAPQETHSPTTILMGI